MARHEPKSRAPGCGSRAAQAAFAGPSPGSVLLPQPAAREDDEQKREQAEAERQPPIHRQHACARHPGGAGQVSHRNALGKTSMVPWSRIAMSTLPRMLLKTQVKMNVTATIQNQAAHSLIV